MTPRQRLLKVLSGGIPDCVPVAPDISNMVPARLTGKPFWDLYLYQDPPVFEAYIAAAKHFNFDSVMDGYCKLIFPDEVDPDQEALEPFIVIKEPARIVVQKSYKRNNRIRLFPHPVYRFIKGYHFKSELYDDAVYQIADLFYLYREFKYVIKFIDLLEPEGTALYRDALLLRAKAL